MSKILTTSNLPVIINKFDERYTGEGELAFILRQDNTAYAIDDIVYISSLGMKYHLECTTAGITATTAPVITPPVTAGQTITDGTVVWTVRQCLSTSGGAVSGIIKRDTNDAQLTLAGYNDFKHGSQIVLFGDKYGEPRFNGGIQLRLWAADLTTEYKYLILRDGQSINTALKERDLGGSAIVAKSLGANSYIKYASGLIIQFGRKPVHLNSGSTVQGTLDFPISFTTTNYAFASTACPIDTSAPFEYSITSKQTKLVGIIFPSGITSTRMYLDYVAIGY